MKSLLLTFPLLIPTIANIVTNAVGQEASPLIEVVAEGTGLTTKTALLKKALADFPTLVTAESAGNPEFDRETSEVVVDVLLKVDITAYTSHQKRLEEMLAKICLDKTSLLIKAGPADNSNPPLKRGVNPDFRTTQRGSFNEKVAAGSAAKAFLGPPLSGKTGNGWTVWVNSFRNGTHTSTRWNGYVVDADVAESIKSLTGQTMINVALLDAGGELITEDEFEFLTRIA